MADKEPNGRALLDTLVRLLAEQEGVNITYEVKDEGVKKHVGTH